MEFETINRLAKEFALVWFFLLFVGIVLWAFWPGNRKRFEQAGRMALDDDGNDVQASREPQAGETPARGRPEG
ncbi:MAG: cbb3-type cytochrome c oxidase subunit 3 [Magnetococcales bacterium]|nr:cbb3-type cytochrome c oxidase subunit 3 [Magnetococcales bacterium]